jgi:hypothetical protein
LGGKPLLAVDTGYEQCSDGHIHRSSKFECPSSLPRDRVHMALPGDSCATDADCTAKSHGYCGQAADLLSKGMVAPYSCQYGCRTDSDCERTQICLCGAEIGTCVLAACKTDAECGADLECASYYSRPTDIVCSRSAPAFACQTPADSCGGPNDCPRPPGGWSDCVFGGGSRACASIQSCAVAGRPFLVHGGERLASLTERSDWLEGDLEPNVAGLDQDLRQSLAARWARLGCMEHASIAAFARFVLQLLSLGAPAALIEQANLALKDETRHARACFSVASCYAGHPIGPGPLAVEGSLDAASLEEILVLTVREGCIGETVAAIEALEASEHAEDPVIRALLQRISADETRHAELAWRFVTWALSGLAPDAPERSRVAAELERGRAPMTAARPAELDAESQRYLAHGLLPESLSTALRSAVDEKIVGPCAFALGLLATRERGLAHPA